MDFRRSEARDVLSVAEAVTWKRRDEARIRTGYRVLLSSVLGWFAVDSYPTEDAAVLGVLSVAALVSGVDSYLEWRRSDVEAVELAEFRSDLS